MDTLKLTLLTAIFEGTTRIYKTSLLHELKLEEVEKLTKQKEIATNRKEKREIDKAIEAVEKHFEVSIKRAEKYNTEITQIVEKNIEIEPLIDSSIDLYSHFTEILLQTTQGAEKGKRLFAPCLLEQSEDGTVEIDGNKYILHTYKK